MGAVEFPNGMFLLGDCFEQMAGIPDGSVDMVLCDLPYGTTDCAWDRILPVDRLWREYWRVCAPGAVVVLTADQPFTTHLIASQLEAFRYSCVWNKVGTVGHINAKRRPLRQHEDILVFCKRPPAYYPQMRTGKLRTKGGRKDRSDQTYRKIAGPSVVNDQYYPTSILEFSNAGNKGCRLHPTQKPVALFEYLIRTYTNPDEVVLDNTAGSGTTAIAAENAGRRWVCIEKDQEYFWRAVDRIATHVTKVA